MQKNMIINVTTPDAQDAKITVNYVSTTASDQDLYDFANSIVGLTQNTLVSVQTVTTTEIKGV